MSKDIIKTELIDTSPRQNDLLNYAIEKGIIDFDSVHDDYMASKKEQILKNDLSDHIKPNRKNFRHDDVINRNCPLNIFREL